MIKINLENVNSFSELARVIVSESKQATKPAMKLFQNLVLADLGGRADALHKSKGIRLDEPYFKAEDPAFEEALVSFAKRIPVSAELLDRIMTRYYGYVFGSKRLMGLEDSLQYAVLDKAKGLIEDAINGEVDFQEFKSQVLEQTDYLNTSQLKLIFDQNILNAYNAGSWSQLYEQMDTDENLYFSTAHDERVDDFCKEFDGFIAPKSDARWQQCWPPLHFLCRCTVRLSLAGDRSKTSHPDVSVIPEDFRNWPGQGFTLALPTSSEMNSVKSYLENIAA